MNKQNIIDAILQELKEKEFAVFEFHSYDIDSSNIIDAKVTELGYFVSTIIQAKKCKYHRFGRNFLVISKENNPKFGCTNEGCGCINRILRDCDEPQV